MRKGDKIRVPRSPKHKRKLSLAMIGNKNQERVHSLTTRAKISLSMNGNQNTRDYIHGATMRLRCSLAKLAEKNPLWLGGISFLPYTSEWTPTFRHQIKEGDSFTCQLCFVTPEDIKELHVHHIDYDKTNNRTDNLISLCHSCHSKTNHHRTEWGVYNGQFQRNEANVRDRYEGSPRVR
ncbi:hypothetical protein LCGC14_2023630 [marine sediment metagenome]|uniref:HNH domain-containing protein n=1 Tax=marine sediment metagenome TaxID=412755 RepID=A0A0F9HA50_9ZZZZ